MITLLIGFVALVAIVAVVWTLYEVVGFVRDFFDGVGLRGCLQLLAVLAIFGLVSYELGLLISPIITPK